MTHNTVPYLLYSTGILYREGLEALLVVLALAAGTRDATRGTSRGREIYTGAGIAVLASIMLAWGVNHIITDDASDTMEGIFQLLAAATLFYVSSWLTSKAQSERWMGFIRSKVEGARASAIPGLALALTAFMAVIREGAETIVFFQALTAGATEPSEKRAVAAGIAIAAVGLAATFAILHRAAWRLPFGRVFRMTSVLLYALAVIFVGQGIASLQEAGWVGVSFIDYAPTIPALGIFPTIQSLGAQLAMVLVACAAIFIPRAQDAAEEAPGPTVRAA